MTSRLFATPFAPLPEWILEAPISDRAVRLYALLQRAAKGNSTTFPGRSGLAKKLHCSTKSIDRALGELREIGALEIKHRDREDGGQTSNDYVLWPANKVPHWCPPPLDTSDAPPLDTRDEGILDIESKKSIERETASQSGVASRVTHRDRDPLFEAMVEVLGVNVSELTTSLRGQINRALKELRAVGATADEIRRRAAAYHRKYPELDLAAPTLARHWATLGLPPPRAASPIETPEPEPELTPEQRVENQRRIQEMLATIGRDTNE